MKYEKLSDFELIERTMAVMEHVEAMKGHCHSYGTDSCKGCVYEHIEECPIWYLIQEEFERFKDDEALGEYFRDI